MKQPVLLPSEIVDDMIAGREAIIKQLEERNSLLEDLLVSAHAIALRRGQDTAWERFAERLANSKIGHITPRTFRVLPSDTNS